MSFGFSVGDFFAGIELIRSTIDALASSTGSKAQYNGVVHTLQNLETVLFQLQNLDAGAAERQLINDLVNGVRTTLARFDAKISKYKPTLADTSTAKWWRSLPRKIQWQRYTKNDIISLHGELLSHASTLQIGLSTITNTTSSRQYLDVCARLDGLVAEQQDTSSRIEDFEVETFRRLDQAEMTAQTRANQTAAHITSTVDNACLLFNTRCDGTEASAETRHQASIALSRQLHQEMQTSARSHLDACTALIQRRSEEIEKAAQVRFNAVMTLMIEIKTMLWLFLLAWSNMIHQALLRIPSRMPQQALAIFEDAHGYIFHIDTQFVRTWKAFQYVILENFRNRTGYARVARGGYMLFDRFKRSPINKKVLFHEAFRPGRHISQSMIFDRAEAPGNGCPRCGFADDSEADVVRQYGVEVECKQCGMNYRYQAHNVTSAPLVDGTFDDEVRAQNRHWKDDRTGDRPDGLVGPSLHYGPTAKEMDRADAYSRVVIRESHQTFLPQRKRTWKCCDCGMINGRTVLIAQCASCHDHIECPSCSPPSTAWTPPAWNPTAGSLWTRYTFSMIEGQDDFVVMEELYDTIAKTMKYRCGHPFCDAELAKKWEDTWKTSPSAVRKHWRQNHPLEMFACDVPLCNKKFKTKRAVDRHKKIHKLQQ